MRLEYDSDYLSITKFEPIDLPTFTVITGENGTGKTHLLRAIGEGHCRIEGVQPGQTRYFDYGSFTLENPAGITASQLTAAANQHFVEFSNRWKSRAEGIFREVCGKLDKTPAAPVELFREGESAAERILSARDIWNPDAHSAADAPYLASYRSAIEEGLFENNTMLERFPQSKAIIRCLKKFGRPVHIATLEDFRQHFIPTLNSGDFFGLSLGALFSKYKIDEFIWCHDQFEKGSGGSIAKIRGEFRRKNPRPWLLINKLLAAMGAHCLSDQIFKFKVTDPDHIELNLSAYQSFSFSPKLLEKTGRTVCDFDSLSSGEKTLLALVLSMYGAQNTYDFPKVLLLDEIDASLHPSMIKAMLYALQTAFLDKGVCVILATHSPTTVAFSPESSIHLMQVAKGKRRLEPVKRAEAINVLSEGLVTLDEGLKIASELKSRLNIMTEGHNVSILRRYLKLAGIRNVNFIEGLEDRTGKDQLKSYFDLFSTIDEKRVLLVWDCDAENLVARLKETENVFKFCLPRQDNAVASSGIENMFSATLLSEFSVEVKHRRTGNVTVSFDKSQKSSFAERLGKKGRLKDFVAFSSFKEKIVEIQKGL